MVPSFGSLYTLLASASSVLAFSSREGLSFSNNSPLCWRLSSSSFLSFSSISSSNGLPGSFVFSAAGLSEFVPAGCSAASLSEFVPAGCSSSGCAGVVGWVTSEFIGSPVGWVAALGFFVSPVDGVEGSGFVVSIFNGVADSSA